MRLTRSSMLEVMRQDYIRTARAKGASDTAVNYDHALRNAVLPVVTIIGIEAAFLIGGLIVTETVFNIPGVARFLVEAIRWRDYPIVQNLVMFIANDPVTEPAARATTPFAPSAPTRNAARTLPRRPGAERRRRRARARDPRRRPGSRACRGGLLREMEVEPSPLGHRDERASARRSTVVR